MLLHLLHQLIFASKFVETPFWSTAAVTIFFSSYSSSSLNLQLCIKALTSNSVNVPLLSPRSNNKRSRLAWKLFQSRTKLMIVFILPQVDCTLITISSIWRDHRLQRVLPSQVQHEAEKRAMPAAIISIWRLTRKGLTITTRRRRSVNCWWRCCDKLNLLDKCIRWWGRAALSGWIIRYTVWWLARRAGG